MKKSLLYLVLLLVSLSFVNAEEVGTHFKDSIRDDKISVREGTFLDRLDLLWDATNPPTGNEYTAITMQLDSGKDLGVPSDILNYFKNEQPVALGTLKGGDSSVYKITWSISEANADANMDYTILYDDLGGNNGKDVLLNTKGTKDTFTFSGTVAN